MNELTIFNTLGREKQPFKSLEPGKVSFYQCGPTVYWTQHIGNMRGMVMADLVRRSLEYVGYDVSYVRNYTDVGHLSGDNDGDADTGIDRMEKAAKREKKNPQEIADFYIAQFERDTSRLNILLPTAKPRATEYINQMISMVQNLLDNDFAYQTELAIYFDTSKSDEYYKLSGQKAESLITDAGHGEVTDATKKNHTDFALWFFKSGSHEHALQTWSNPFSDTEGFPGWHIECSAMAKDILGKTIDIHMGGIEHVPIHHTNEIAQSEAANGVDFAHYWIHNEHLDVDGSKMAKSEGTAYSLSDIESQGFSPTDLRYFFLQAHYRSKQNFTTQSLEASKTALNRLISKIQPMPQDGLVNNEFKNKFIGHISDDFNISGGLAIVSDVLKSDISDGDKRSTILDFDKVLGLDLARSPEQTTIEVPDEISSLLEERKKARSNKDWARTDELRDELSELGFEVKDTPEGQKVSKK